MDKSDEILAHVERLIGEGRMAEAREMMSGVIRAAEVKFPELAHISTAIEGWEVEQYGRRCVRYKRAGADYKGDSFKDQRVTLTYRPIEGKIWAELTIEGCGWMPLQGLLNLKRKFLGAGSTALLVLPPDTVDEGPMPHIITLRVCLNGPVTPNFWEGR